MEPDRFEDLVRAVATQTSRRGFAGLLGGLALGGTIALASGDESAAAPRRRRRRRKHAKDPFTPSPFAPRCVATNAVCASTSSCCNATPPGTVCIGDVNGPGVATCHVDTCAAVATMKGGKACTPGIQCCRIETNGCTESCECCGSLVCNAGVCATCQKFGGGCSGDSECCDGNYCADGRCVSP